MRSYTEKNPVFSESILITENTDPAFADHINAGPKQLLQNTLVNREKSENLEKQKVDRETHAQDIENINKTVESVLDSLIDLIYPVGSIYTSTANVCPESFIGGEWKPIRDTFLLCAGDRYQAGSSGGSAVKDVPLPTHNHFYTPSGSVSSSFSGTAQSHEHNGAYHSHSIDMNTELSGEHMHDIQMISPNATLDYSTQYVQFGQSEGTTYINSNPISPDGDHKHSIVGSTAHGGGDVKTGTASITPTGSVSSSFKGSAGTTENAGSDAKMNIMPPYRTVYAWERTA